MTARTQKSGYFILEGLNSAAVTYYSYYLYFFMEQSFGFDNEENLALAGLNGLIYVFSAWWGGKFAQRFGYFTSLKLGFGIMALAMLAGPQVHTAAGQVIIMAVSVVGMCFTWPTLEALVSEGESPAGLQKMLGIYNVVWAGTGSMAYFAGGALMEKLGAPSLFYVPAGIQIIQFALTCWLETGSRRVLAQEPVSGSPFPSAIVPLNPRPIAKAKMFLRLAWVANPFAYIAINTVIAVMPGLARRLELSTMVAGFCCSLWCFARLGAFLGLWFWNGWHYRFRWLMASFVAVMAAFIVILLVPNLLVVLLAETVFGVALGLIYYSSLFYSMDVSETKGVHGGIHEAAIGLGNFAGPAVGAAALHFLPQRPNSGAWAVAGLLLTGLLALLGIWRTPSPPPAPPDRFPS